MPFFALSSPDARQPPPCANMPAMPDSSANLPVLRVYMVGGAVRDRLLGLPMRDRDWVI